MLHPIFTTDVSRLTPEELEQAYREGIARQAEVDRRRRGTGPCSKEKHATFVRNLKDFAPKQ